MKGRPKDPATGLRGGGRGPAATEDAGGEAGDGTAVARAPLEELRDKPSFSSAESINAGELKNPQHDLMQ